MGRQATVLNQAKGRIAHRFHARDLHLVDRELEIEFLNPGVAVFAFTFG